MIMRPAVTPKRRVIRVPAAFWIAVLALNLFGCSHIKRREVQNGIQPAGESVEMRRIVGVTLTDGREIRFDKNSLPFVRGDTLKAEVGREPLAIPVAEVERVWVKSLSKLRTGFAVYGIALVVVGTFMGIGFAGP